MGPILYVETNFAIGIAKGQDPHSHRLLNEHDRLVRLIFPGVCYMEALKTLERERKARNVFIDEHLSKQLREMRRDRMSDHSSKLVAHLEGAITAARGSLSDFENSIQETLERLAIEAETIPVDQRIVVACIKSELTEDLADGLILQCVLHHAQTIPDGPKAFLSANTRHFQNEDVTEALAKVGVRYFSSCAAAVGWLTSQPGP